MSALDPRSDVVGAATGAAAAGSGPGPGADLDLTSGFIGPLFGYTANGALRTWPIWAGPEPEALLHPWQHMPVPLTPLVAPAPLTDPALEGRDEY